MKPSSKLRHLRYKALRRSLQETVAEWPYIYEHKIIGKNQDDFIESLENLEQTLPRLNKKTKNISRNGTYLSITYELLARDVDEIIGLWVASEKLKNFVTVI